MRNVHDITHLPFGQWNENMIILGIPYGNEQYVNEFWKEKYENFDKDSRYYESFNSLTLQAKAIVSKSKLMPKLSYYGSVLPIPPSIQEKVNKRAQEFQTGLQPSLLIKTHEESCFGSIEESFKRKQFI